MCIFQGYLLENGPSGYELLKDSLFNMEKKNLRALRNIAILLPRGLLFYTLTSNVRQCSSHNVGRLISPKFLSVSVAIVPDLLSYNWLLLLREVSGVPAATNTFLKA